MRARLLVIVFGVLFVLPQMVVADVQEDEGGAVDLLSISYMLELVYDESAHTLRQNDDARAPYHVVTEHYAPDVTLKGSDFSGVVVGQKKEILATFGIMIPTQVSTGAEVPVRPRAPYFPTGDHIDVHKAGTKLFSILVSGSAICHVDAICKSDAGETVQNCKEDCRETPITFADEEKKVGDAFVIPNFPQKKSDLGEPLVVIQTPVDDAVQKSNRLKLVLAIALFGLSIATFFVWLVLRARARAEA